MKKKALALLFAVVMIFVVAACTSNPYIGKWKATGYTQDGLTMDMETIGANITFEIKGNGSAIGNVNGNEGMLEWEMSGDDMILRDSNDTVKFSIKDGKMVTSDIPGLESGELIFEKQ